MMTTETWPAGQTSGSHTYGEAGTFTVSASQPSGRTGTTAVTVDGGGGSFFGAVYSSPDGQTFTRTTDDPVTTPLVAVIVTETDPPDTGGFGDLIASALTAPQLIGLGVRSIRSTPPGAPGGLEQFRAMDDDPPVVPLTVLAAGQAGQHARVVLYADAEGTDVLYEIGADFQPA